jgi:hypothetical protein
MEDYQQTEQTSANIGEVAETQTEGQAGQEISANHSEVANPNPVQDAETNARYADMRRKQELDQYRTQAETYQQQLDRAAQLMGYQSNDEFVQAMDQYEQQLQQQQQQELYQQAGIDPDTFNQLLSNHPAIQYANQLHQQQQEEQKLASEWGELAQEFPDITPEKVPPEVFQLQASHPHLSLLDAYLRVSYKSLGQQKEQEAIQKLQQNQLSSPGALSQGADHITSYSQLSAQDKKALRERVLRGENIQL